MSRTTSLHELLRWYLENLDVPPMRLVSREVDDGGTPQWTAEFRRWLYNERTLRREIVEGVCDHPSKAEGTLCGRCSVYGEDGAPMAETGRYRRERTVYAYPMRAAISRITRTRVPAGMPPYGILLWAVAASRGDLALAVHTLDHAYPALADRPAAGAHLRRALVRLRDVYAIEPFPRVRRKSEAQLDAEAVA